MRRTTAITLAAVLSLGAFAGTDGDLEDHPCYDETSGDLAYPEQQVWFHEGSSKIGNTNTDAHPFDTTAPATSVTGGAGAAQHSAIAANAGTFEDNYEHIQASFTGTFTGCIDTLLIDMFSFDWTNRSSTGKVNEGDPGGLRDHTFRVIVEVDGVEVLNAGPLEANTTHYDGGLGPNLNRRGIEVGSVIESFADAGILSIGADVEHTLTVRLAPWFVNTGHATYVWDTTEVPSGMTFNGAITEDYLPKG